MTSISLDAVPPPPPIGDDDSSVSSVSTSSTSSSPSTTSSGMCRNRFMLPRVFRQNKATLGDSGTGDANGGNQNSISLPSFAGGERLSPPSSLVPMYKDENRMLMRSPLPSPRAPAKKLIPRPRTLADDSDGEDGRSEREKMAMRRLVNMAKQQQNFAAAWFAASAGEEPMLPALQPRTRRKRLVMIQQRQRSMSSASSVSSGPVDLDSGEEWDETQNDDEISLGGSSTSSTGSSKMCSFLQTVLPQSKSGEQTPPRQKSPADIEIGTPSTAAGSPDSTSGNVSSERDENNESQNKPGFWTTRPGQVLFVLFLLLSISAIVVGSVFYARQNSNRNSTTSSSQGNEPDGTTFGTSSPTITPVPTISPTITSAPTSTRHPTVSPTMTPSDSPTQRTPSVAPTLSPEPTAAPSVSPSVAPSMFPSASPSFMPTVAPSDTPSTMPSVSPSATPSVSPTSAPSVAPSASPTISHAPSSVPSQAPSSVFSITVFEQLGSTLEGDMAREHFGNSISLSADATVLAIGARHSELDGKRRAGRVEVFELVGDTWVQRGDDTLFGRNRVDQFGFGVALSSDGNRLAVSEPGFDGPAGDRSGNVRIFDWIGGAWVQAGNDVGGEAATDLFGLALSLSGDGNRLAVGAPYHDNDNGALAGRVRVFEFSSQTRDWEAVGDALDGSLELDWFGWDIDLSDDGSKIAVGAPRNSEYGGYVRCFEWQQGRWSQTGNDIVNDFGTVQLEDRFGLAVSMSANGERVAVGAPWKDNDSSFQNSGLAAVYQLSDNAWSMIGNALEGEGLNHQLGWSLQLSATGEFLAVGIPGHDQQGPNSGRVTYHRWDGNAWDTATTALNGALERDEFGFDVAVSDNGATLAVGATVSSGTTAEGAGYVQVFEAV